ncbi:unnamed protein product [Oppiella nova]|uniref:7-dehydrocholesterol reductase n=2 Tax=Oppiella nova TaxID=334625 RepID=A0A7R9QNR0_9ACAR|nr:unnamed protein product [Oppiella nova]CAG2168640.1 unnamed protein product [Oppiella nova]
MITTPNIILVLAYVIVAKNCNLSRTLLSFNSLESTVTEAWKSIKWYDLECWSIVCGLILWGIISLHFPGRKYHGPPTPNGYRPEYWNSGFKFYVISMLIAIPVLWNYSVLHLYYKIPNLIAILIAFGVIFCVILYLKGLVFPDPGICDITKNLIFDYYWGVELYPHLGPFVSLKILINSRFGLFLWQLLALTAWKANYELYIASYNRGHINWPLTTTTLLISIYLAKFYYSEDSYLHTIDASHDRFGYYLAWGCIAFVPAFYSLNSLYLVKHSPIDHFGFVSSLIVLSLGLLCVYLTYCTDRQKMLARQTNGKCNIWGKPATVIRATYTDNYGIQKRTVLLVSGFWSVGRHMNYTFELLFAVVLCLPSLVYSPIPYLRLIFVSILLIHRTYRDDEKCSQKYGTQWDEYCKLVPYKMIPGLF